MEEYKRYRDDTFDVSTNTSIEEQHLINEWLNNNVYKGKIKFKLDCDPKSIPFLDVRVNLINGFLLTETYSKDTDIHQYLHPSSCHPQHIFKGIPKALGIRITRNCSDRYEGDLKFIENLREFKGYMITSGYKEEVVDQAFGKLANMSRNSILWKKTSVTRKKRNARKYRFVTSHEPAFPDIKQIVLKHQHIILDADELKKVFPNGAKDFQVSERRKAKNLKELLAKSKIATL